MIIVGRTGRKRSIKGISILQSRRLSTMKILQGMFFRGFPFLFSSTNPIVLMDSIDIRNWYKISSLICMMPKLTSCLSSFNKSTGTSPPSLSCSPSKQLTRMMALYTVSGDAFLFPLLLLLMEEPGSDKFFFRTDGTALEHHHRDS